jgi:hypothetical protein
MKEIFEDTLYILCIGKDNNIHRCEPHSDKCYCGIPVQRKFTNEKDFASKYWCGECDSIYDQSEA